MSRPLAQARSGRPASRSVSGPLARLLKPIRLWRGLPYVRQADQHRARSEWIEAVLNYHRGLDWLPWRDDLKVQIGNCWKEYGDYREAVKAYSSVTASANRPEAMKQMADANRRAGVVILPYAVTEDAGEIISAEAEALPVLTDRLLPNRLKIEVAEPRRWMGPLGRTDHRAVRSKGSYHPSIVLDQVGTLSLERDGVAEPLLTGVIAIRARVVSPMPIETVEIHLGNGEQSECIAVAPAKPVERGAGQFRLSVVNCWIDAGRLPRGRHWLSIHAGRLVPTAGLPVTVADADGLGDALASSNAFVPAPVEGGLIDDAIIAAPTQSRPAARSLFDRPIRHILAIRVDQLGDVSASLPAIARLREMFPEARVTVLVQPGVRAILEASGLAEEVVTVELPYSEVTERRHLRQEDEDRLRTLFSGGDYDLAIDLCTNDETRPLLLLTGATYLVGFNADRFTFLDYGIGLRSRDKVNQLEKLSHAASVMTLVEALAVAVTPTRPPVPRKAGSDEVLARFGLEPRGYVAMHTGARHAINRWPSEYFVELAERVAAETDHKVVIFSDDETDRERLAPEARERVQFLPALDTDSFDAILANARLVVGNDSGPKHLAATRGVPTVSIHVARLNWNEWGQDSEGMILSKRVPCTGCGLNDLQLCGRDAVCVRAIRVDEVMAAARRYL